jgi:hypothetical protein
VPVAVVLADGHGLAAATEVARVQAGTGGCYVLFVQVGSLSIAPSIVSKPADGALQNDKPPERLPTKTGRLSVMKQRSMEIEGREEGANSKSADESRQTPGSQNSPLRRSPSPPASGNASTVCAGVRSRECFSRKTGSTRPQETKREPAAATGSLFRASRARASRRREAGAREPMKFQARDRIARPRAR